MRNDLDHEVRRLHRFQHRVVIDLAVLVAHGGGSAEHRAVMQRADQHVALDRDLRRRQLFRKAPELAAAGDRPFVVQIHRMDVGALLALEADRDHLPGFGVVAETGRVGHADEFVFDQRLGDLERLRHHGGERLGVGAVGDDEIFAVEEAIGPRRKRRVGQRHRIGGFPDVVDLHGSPHMSPARSRDDGIMGQTDDAGETVKSAAQSKRRQGGDMAPRISPSVIPGRRIASNPESITTIVRWIPGSR